MIRTTFMAPLAIITAMLLLALGDNFIPAVAGEMSVWQYHALRASMILPLIVVAMSLWGLAGTIWPRRPLAVFTRSGCVITALMLYFAAIPAVSISLAAAGLFTSPIFVVLISVFAFGERVGPRRLAAMVLGFLGVCLVLGVGTEPLRPMAIAPMLGGAFYAVSVIWTRRYCQQESAGALAFWNMTGFLLAGALGMALTPWLAGSIGHIAGTEFATMPAALPSRPIFLVVLAMGVLAALGMVLLAYGYRSADPTFAGLFDYSFLFWAPLFAWVIRGETLSAVVGFGMALIVLAGWLALTGLERRAAEP